MSEEAEPAGLPPAGGATPGGGDWPHAAVAVRATPRQKRLSRRINREGEKRPPDSFQLFISPILMTEITKASLPSVFPAAALGLPACRTPSDPPAFAAR